jgi:hypothetical protein
MHIGPKNPTRGYISQISTVDEDGDNSHDSMNKSNFIAAGFFVELEWDPPRTTESQTLGCVDRGEPRASTDRGPLEPIAKVDGGKQRCPPTTAEAAPDLAASGVCEWILYSV